MSKSDPTQKRLTEKQLALVNALLTAEKISIEAAGVKAGFSPKTAAQIASRALALPHVAAYYQAELAKRAERTGIDADYVLQRLASIDAMDVGDIYDDDGKLLPIKQWPALWRQMVKEVDMKTGKVKLQDKLKTLELIGKHVGVKAFSEQIEVTDSTGIAARMLAARDRAAKANGGGE
jgi:phage terminase small subunit